MNDLALAVGNQSLQPTTDLSRSRVPLNGLESLFTNWPEYLMEAGGIAAYLFVACGLATAASHPGSPIPHFIHDSLFRGALMGVLTGAAVVGIVMTPWGKQSGGISIRQ